MARSIAGQLVAQLIDAGVNHIYGIVGDSLNPVVDAVRRTRGSAKGGIDWIHVRHEEAAAFMASAEAQLTGRLAVCAGSCGPGNLHLINGLFDAHRSKAPVLAIASHIPSANIGSGSFQETHPERLFVECSNYCELVFTAEQSPHVVNSALRHAIAGPDVSVVVIPGDIARFDASSSFPTLVVTEPSTLVPAEADVQPLADAINAAKTVAIFAGAGVEGAHDEVVAFAELLKAPVGHSLSGKQWIQGFPSFGVDVPEVDFAGVARAIGFHAERVEAPGSLRDAIDAALAHDGPALVDIVTDPRALSLPPAITGQEVVGFGLAMSKMVLDGGAAEAVAMARSNIRHVPGL